MLECVVNVSEGRDEAVLQRLAAAGGDALLDLHRDPHHHRAVLTLVGEEAPRAVAEEAIRSIDVRVHHGVHPRLGAVDVVPFVPLEGTDLARAVEARDDFAAWFGGEHGVPCFRYGTERSLPNVRRLAFRGMEPDTGPPRPHPTAGASAVGARPPLVAYNVWVHGAGLAAVRAVAAEARRPGIRALGLSVGERLQVSMNLVSPAELGPADAYDLVVGLALAHGLQVVGAELVGLIPAAVLGATDPSRWAELDLSEARTIEARLAGR